jgi:hypothetical protein
MKKYIIILASIIVFGCSEDEINNRKSITGTWKVLAYEDLLTGVITTKTLENSWGKDVTITLDDTTDPHEFSGHTTSNTMWGYFSYESESTLKIRYMATLVAESEWGVKFSWAISHEILDYTLAASELKIYNYERNIGVTFIKE